MGLLWMSLMAMAMAALPPSSRIEKTPPSLEDQSPSHHPIATTAPPFQDYPDYDMGGWGESRLSSFSPAASPRALPLLPTSPPYVSASRPPLSYRGTGDRWVFTRGDYPELINLNRMSGSLPDVGIPPLTEPAVPRLPVIHFPSHPYPSAPPPPPLPPRPSPVEGGDWQWGERLPHRPRLGSHPPRTRTIPSPYGYSYAAYVAAQSKMYPIMIYTLDACPSCQSAKRLLAVYYPDVASHFLELAGEEEWQRQLHIDLQNLTGAGFFPYIFVCGEYIGGAAQLYQLHRTSHLRSILQRCPTYRAKEK